MKDEIILRVVVSLMVPLVLIYGFYVIFHGESGPGGGFQGGVILATGIILHALVNGMQASRRVLSERLTLTLAFAGVLVYVLVGLGGLVRGGRFLEHGVLIGGAAMETGVLGDPAQIAGHVVGITIIEAGIGIGVAAVMLTIYEALFGE